MNEITRASKQDIFNKLANYPRHLFEYLNNDVTKLRIINLTGMIQAHLPTYTVPKNYSLRSLMKTASELPVFNLTTQEVREKIVEQREHSYHGITLLTSCNQKLDELKNHNQDLYFNILELYDQMKHILDTYADDKGAIHRDQTITAGYQVDMEILKNIIYYIIRMNQINIFKPQNAPEIEVAREVADACTSGIPFTNAQKEMIETWLAAQPLR